MEKWKSCISRTEAADILDVAMQKLPELTDHHVNRDSLVFAMWQHGGRELRKLGPAMRVQKIEDEFRKRRGELIVDIDRRLRQIAWSVAWIDIIHQKKKWNRRQGSYTYKHCVERMRIRGESDDPYVPEGMFIAAAVGRCIPFKIDVENGYRVIFKFGQRSYEANRFNLHSEPREEQVYTLQRPSER